MFQRHEDADAAGGRIDRAGKGDDQEQRVIVDDGKGDASGDHQAGSREQKLAVIVARADKADADSQEGGAKERSRGNNANLQRIEAEREQIDRQEDGYEAVAEITQRAGRKEIGCRVDLPHR